MGKESHELLIFGSTAHKCAIQSRKDELLRLIPGKGRVAQFRRGFRNMCLVTSHWPIARIILKSGRAMEMERRRQLHFSYYMIHPFSYIRGIWEGLMVVLLSMQTFIVPYVATYLPRTEHDAFENYFMLFALMVDILGILDILAAFNSGTFINSTTEIILDRTRVSLNYLKGDFIYDLLSCVPTQLCLYLPEPTGENGDFQMTPFFFFAFMKILHIRTIYVYLMRSQIRTDTTSYVTKLFRQCFMLSFALHWLACFKLLLTRLVNGDIEDYITQQSWTQKMKFMVSYPYDRYIISLYSVVCACTTYGFGLAPSFAHEDMIFNMILFVFGSFLKIVVASQTLLLVRNTSTSKLKYQTVLQQLREFMRYKQLPMMIRKRLLDYYEFRFQKNFYKEDHILGLLSTQLQQEIILYSCRRLVVSVPFFQNIPNALLVRIVTSLQSEIYLPQDNIITAGHKGKNMYFIGSGTVAVYGTDGLEVSHLSDGSHFGEIALINDNAVRSASIIAIETCELYALGRDDFLAAMEPYPEILERIREEAMARLHATAIRKWTATAKTSKHSNSIS